MSLNANWQHLATPMLPPFTETAVVCKVGAQLLGCNALDMLHVLDVQAASVVSASFCSCKGRAWHLQIWHYT
jgi:hypothetical protein